MLWKHNFAERNSLSRTDHEVIGFIFFNNAFGLSRNIISKTGQKVFRVVLPTFSTGVGCICFRLLLRNLPYKFFIFSSNEAFPRHLVKERGKQVTINKASVIHP